MNPSLGRIVHYHDESSYDGRTKTVNVRAAIIVEEPVTHVYLGSETEPTTAVPSMVKLVVFVGHQGSNQTSYFVEAPYSPTPKAGHWSWPPKVGK